MRLRLEYSLVMFEPCFCCVRGTAVCSSPLRFSSSRSANTMYVVRFLPYLSGEQVLSSVGKRHRGPL